MKVFKGKIWAAIGSLMDHAGTTPSSTTKPSSASVPDRALLAAIEAAVERCTTTTTTSNAGDDDRHVHEILFLVSNSPGAITFLSRRITSRLESSPSPSAALRSLLLVHRLLRAGDRYFEHDLRSLWSSRHLRLHSPLSSSAYLTAGVPTGAAACLTAGFPTAAAAYLTAGAATGACAFVHGYSAYLEERMQWVINQAGNLEPAPSPPATSSSDADGEGETLVLKLAMCQRLLDLAIQLLPDNNTSGCAAARSAFGIVVRESFKVYDAFTEGLDAMMMLMRRSRTTSRAGMSKPMRVSAHEILKKACAQTMELKEFYHKCKRSNASKSLEYPLVRVVTPASVMEMESMPIVEEEEGQEETPEPEPEPEPEAEIGGGSTFARKMETTISTVWVEFEEDEKLIYSDGDEHSLESRAGKS